MTRIAVIAPKAVQKEVIESLHETRLAHIEEFSQGDAEDLDIGSPLEDGSQASELLVRLRGIMHACHLDEEGGGQVHQDIVHEKLRHDLPEIEEEVREVADRRDELTRALDGLRDTIDRLEPLEPLPLELKDYSGYETLRVFVGHAPRDLSPELSTAIERFEYFSSPAAHAIFVHNDEAERAQEILAREGFREIDVPEGAGTVGENLAELNDQRDHLEQELSEVDGRLQSIAREHKDFLLAAEEDLSIQVEKAEAPLNFASTERAFVADTWVPSAQVESLRAEVREAAGGAVHFEIIDEGARDPHHREAEPPTKYDHPKGVGRFSFLLDLFSPPRYDEIDPTFILFLVFPFFFGFMIGDLGYGILMVALGLFLYRRVGPKSEAAGSLGFALLLSGIWATLFGAFIFHDVLGIPYVPHGEGQLAWFSYHGSQGLLGIELHGGWATHVPLEKLGDDGVKSMLALSVLAAFVHLFVGFIFSFINHLGHSRKHALAQIGWMAVLAGLALLAIVKGPENEVSDWLLGVLGEPTLVTGAYFLGPGVVLLVLTEGAMGVMETIGLFSNIISYTRLAGVAVAKGAMAGAFNFVFLEGMVLEQTASPAIIIAGFLLFVLAQMVVFVLGMISSGIQSIRLNYVEFFLKFYEGGGKPFKPFGRDRRFTLTPSTR